MGEWNEKTMGHFNYITNREKVFRYWEDRVSQTKDLGAVYSMGMRGVHDSKMEGVKDEKEAVPLLERIIADQRDLLKKYLNKDKPFRPNNLKRLRKKRSPDRLLSLNICLDLFRIRCVFPNVNRSRILPFRQYSHVCRAFFNINVAI